MKHRPAPSPSFWTLQVGGWGLYAVLLNELTFWKKARVHPDYHVEVEGHLYSVPYSLAHKQVEARYTEGSLEVFLGGRRVASHVRKHVKGYTTLKEHMPANHRAHAEWTPERLVTWAEKTGPATAALVQGLMERKPHPEQAFRGALGGFQWRTSATWNSQGH